MSWRSHAHLLYSNWLNYSVYQKTPFDLSRLLPPGVKVERRRAPRGGGP